MPTRSASLNFTPGRSSLSSSNTSNPAASKLRAISSAVVFSFSSATLVGVTTISKGAICGGSQKPFSSLLCSIAAVRMRSIPMP